MTYLDEVHDRALVLVLDEGLSAARVRERLAAEGFRAPCEGTLARWAREERARRGLPPARRPGARLTPGEVRVARHLWESGASCAQAARMIGRGESTVYAWRRRQNWRRTPMIPPQRRDQDDRVACLNARIEALEAENQAMHMRMDLMVEIEKLLKHPVPADLGRDVANHAKAVAVANLKDRWPFKALLEQAGLSRSTYYWHHSHRVVSARGAKAERERRLRALIVDTARRFSRIYGYRRIHHELAVQGVTVSEKFVRQVLREEDLVPRYVRKSRHYSSFKGDPDDAPANLVARDFHAPAPGMVWVTDVTQFTMDGYKCYLSPIVDCADGVVVSWTLALRPTTAMVVDMLERAASTLQESQRPIVHTDRGCQYSAREYKEAMARHGFTRSMSAKGCSPDNAAAEGFFGRLKNEMFHHRDWTGVTFPEFAQAVRDYIDFYNHKRAKQSLGWLTPMQRRTQLTTA